MPRRKAFKTKGIQDERHSRQKAFKTKGIQDIKHSRQRVLPRRTAWCGSPLAGRAGACRPGEDGGGAPNAGTAPDCLQPPLVPRCGFRQQVSASVRCTQAQAVAHGSRSSRRGAPARRSAGGRGWPSTRGLFGAVVPSWPRGRWSLGGLSRAGAEAGGACGGAAGGRPTPPNHALERTGHSLHFVARRASVAVARRSPRALGANGAGGKNRRKISQM